MERERETAHKEKLKYYSKLGMKVKVNFKEKISILKNIARKDYMIDRSFEKSSLLRIMIFKDAQSIQEKGGN